MVVVDVLCLKRLFKIDDSFRYVKYEDQKQHFQDNRQNKEPKTLVFVRERAHQEAKFE